MLFAPHPELAPHLPAGQAAYAQRTVCGLPGCLVEESSVSCGHAEAPVVGKTNNAACSGRTGTAARAEKP